MPPVAKKSKKTDDFVPMKRTRAMLTDIWNHARDVVGHTPDSIKTMLLAAVQDIYKSEVKAVGKTANAHKKAATKMVKKAKKKIGSGTKAVKRKLK